VTVPFWTTVYVRVYDSLGSSIEVPSTTVLKLCMLDGSTMNAVPFPKSR
jgi:hypothetical protein